MKVDKLNRLFEALDGKASSRKLNNNQSNQAKSREGVARDDAAAVQLSSEVRQVDRAPDSRATRVEELKRQREEGSLRSSDIASSEELAEKLLVDLF